MAQHLSVRAPWKDNGYSGLVCDKPCYSNACLRVVNIADNRNAELEDSLRGCPILGHEKELDLGEDGIRIPDFTIDDAESGLCFYWEHCGMLGDAVYNKHLQEKKDLYKKHGIIEGQNLIVSKDSLNGGIDSAEIKRLIDTYLL